MRDVVFRWGCPSELTASANSEVGVNLMSVEVHFRHLLTINPHAIPTGTVGAATV